MMEHNEQPMIEIDIPIEESLGHIRAYTKKRKSRVMGLCAFALAMIAGILLLLSLGKPLLAFLNKEMNMSDIRLAQIGVLITVAISAVAFVLSIVTYFFKKQKKGFAIAATVISLLIFLSSGAAVYGYQYVFGAVKQDEAFDQLSKEELFVVDTKHDGEVDREATTNKPTIAVEDIEQFVKGHEESNPNLEIEWEYLTNSELPEEALEKMSTAKPKNKSYLTGNHKDILNFVLYGLDDSGSSDSIMIFSVDKVHHKLKLISIPRDSYVKIPAWGTSAKLAYSYTWGGAEWAVGTLNFNYSLNITEYISVNIDQLADIIDLVGGVYVDLNYLEVEYLRRFPEVYQGRCLLSGEAAVSYSRLREPDNEIKRTGRQREVLMAIMQQVQNLPFEDYPMFIRRCLGMCTTSFNNEQLMEICAEVVQNDYTIEQHALIDYMDYWGGVLGKERYFYVVYDLNRASDQLYRLIYEDLYISGYTD